MVVCIDLHEYAPQVLPFKTLPYVGITYVWIVTKQQSGVARVNLRQD
jgi:hypothetical protein